MTFTKVETSILPKNSMGKKFANIYCKRLEEQGIEYKRKETLSRIIIEANYRVAVCDADINDD